MWRFPGFPWIVAAFLGGLVSACDRQDAPRRVDTAPETATAAVPADAPATAWVSALGSMLVVPGDSAGTGIVIFPEAPTSRMLQSGPLKLLAPAGDSSLVQASLVATDSQVCGEAPLIRVQDSLATSWTVGVVGSVAAAIPMDSLEALSRADSSKLAAELARLASTVPMQSDSRFKGLPFALLRARQFVTGGRRVVVSHLVRRVPHEAAPVEEHTFIVAERDSATASTALALLFHLRSEGTEETADQFEVLAAVRAGDGVWLILSRDNAAQTTYQ
ncbi:MAG: hypothetical protein ACREOK_04045, partial [Gemmatimonadaceae bacterium]